MWVACWQNDWSHLSRHRYTPIPSTMNGRRRYEFSHSIQCFKWQRVTAPLSKVTWHSHEIGLTCMTRSVVCSSSQSETEHMNRRRNLLHKMMADVARADNSRFRQMKETKKGRIVMLDNVLRPALLPRASNAWVSSLRCKFLTKTWKLSFFFPFVGKVTRLLVFGHVRLRHRKTVLKTKITNDS